MKTYSKDFYDDWLSDKISDLRKEFADLNKVEYLKFCEDNRLDWKDSFSYKEFADMFFDNFQEYAHNQFNLWSQNE